MFETQNVAASIEANSRAFFKESVAKSMLADEDSDQWRFAIISIVQSFELLLKARLETIHPAFIFENIDAPNKYVGIQKAIDRISSNHIGGHKFNARDRKRLQTAINARNEYTHGAGHYTPQHAQSVFFEVLALVTNFFKDVFGLSLTELLSSRQFDFVINNMQSRNSLRRRAIDKIKVEGISDRYIRECCECLEDTFVLHDGKDTCYTCQHCESVIECPCCNEVIYFEHEFIDLSSYFSSSFDEGQLQVHNRYMTDYNSVCPDCAAGEVERITTLRLEEDWEYEEMLYGMETVR
ncbi:hypothetical protein EDF68_104127 [Ochrobactrum sp. BH3]|nr:hypothetical protein EDF68_104127 [Ochrobactrum sp. BH3]